MGKADDGQHLKPSSPSENQSADFGFHLLRFAAVLPYFGLIVGVPGEGNGVVGNLLDVANGVEALFVVS